MPRSLLALPGGFGGVGGGYTGKQAVCCGLSFDKDGRLHQTDEKYSTNAVDFDRRTNFLDCRSMFWTVEEIAEIRRTHEVLAAAGDYDAAWILAKEYGDTDPISKLAVDSKDIALAKMLLERVAPNEVGVGVNFRYSTRCAVQKADGEIVRHNVLITALYSEHVGRSLLPLAVESRCCT